MSFMGELSDIGVPDLLYLLGLRRQTGKLTISAGGEEATLYLDRGQLSFITSSNMALRLGRMLIRLGYLSMSQLQEALREQEESGRDRGLGMILLERGWLSERELRHCIEEQCIEILARVIASDRGIFNYQRGATLPSRTEYVPLNTDRIVLEATRRSDELVELRRHAPDPTAVLMLRHGCDAAIDSLSETETLIVLTLQGNAMSMAELGQRLGLDELTLLRSVARLRQRGIVLTGSSELPPLENGKAAPPSDQAADEDASLYEEASGTSTPAFTRR